MLHSTNGSSVALAYLGVTCVEGSARIVTVDIGLCQGRILYTALWQRSEANAFLFGVEYTKHTSKKRVAHNPAQGYVGCIFHGRQRAKAHGLIDLLHDQMVRRKSPGAIRERDIQLDT